MDLYDFVVWSIVVKTSLVLVAVAVLHSSGALAKESVGLGMEPGFEFESLKHLTDSIYSLLALS